MKQIRYILLLLPILVGIGLSGCATSGVNRGDVNLISLEEEWQMGQQLEAEIAREMDLVRDPSALAYVNEVGQRIVNQTNMRQLPWEFHIVDDPSINAFNIPGGHVYVHTGLIEAADNASQLAGVMAHEIAHGVSRHATERLTKAYGLQIAAGAVLGQNPGIIEQIVAQIAGSGAIAKFSRDDEREADQLGVGYMYQGGYNPEGMVEMFETLLQERQRRPSDIEQFFSTHPLNEERIADIERELSRLPNRSGLITQESGFRNLQARVN